MKKKVLILGSAGMLGQELEQIFLADKSYQVTAWDRHDIDALDFASLIEKLQNNRFDVVYNAIAYNAVDACETDEKEFAFALKLNRDLPQCLAEQSTRLGFTLIHYSTDYVFSGEDVHGGGYTEDALPYPISRYGQSKRAGEEMVEKYAGMYYIIRLSKLFGKPARSAQGKRSFFDVMLEAGRTKPEVKVVNSETSCFTYAPDLAAESKGILEAEEPFGVYHITNSHAVTWYEAVGELYTQVGITTPIIPVSPEAFPRPAKRPVFSALINTKRPLLRPYEEALKEYLAP